MQGTDLESYVWSRSRRVHSYPVASERLQSSWRLRMVVGNLHVVGRGLHRVAPCVGDATTVCRSRTIRLTLTGSHLRTESRR